MEKQIKKKLIRTTAGKKNSGFTGVSGISTRINFVSIDMEVTPHPLLFLPENVIGQAKKTANEQQAVFLTKFELLKRYDTTNIH